MRPKNWQFEYLPVWLVYLPCLPYWLYLSLKARSFTFMTAANPAIPSGGMFGESKSDILNLIPSKYLPTSLLLELTNSHFSASLPNKTITTISINDTLNIENFFKKNGLNYPFILKPDVGERGEGVALLKNNAQLKTYLSQNKGHFIAQAFITYPLEFGVWYYRLPTEKTGHVISITGKEFMTVTGDSLNTIEQLLNTNLRYQQHLETIRRREPETLAIVLPKGKNYIVEPIGNHCRGTKFINCNHLITPELTRNFDTITSTMQGFYLGRFDLKVATTTDLTTAEQLKIMEVNGATSEIGHIYDPTYPILNVYRDLFNVLRIQYKVGKANHQNGTPYTPVFELLTSIYTHLKR